MKDDKTALATRHADGTLSCPRCDAPFDPQARNYCTNCGTLLRDPKWSAVQEESKQMGSQSSDDGYDDDQHDYSHDMDDYNYDDQGGDDNF